jgi:hypothetical protein
MGEIESRRVPAYEGTSTHVSEDEPARLDEAVEAALAAAREDGAMPGDRFDLRIWVELREHNQNVRVYGAVATGQSPSS